MTRLPFHLNNPVPERFRGFRTRAFLVVLVIIGWGLALGWRALHLQVFQHSRLSSLAQKQSQRVITIKGKRGTILDRQGQPLAVSVKSDSFFARPQLIPEPEITSRILGDILGIRAEEIQAKLGGSSPFVWIKRQMSSGQAERIRALDLPGIGFTQEYRRIYPSRTLAASLLGFTGIDNQGLEGLEYAYDSYLRGGERTQVVDVDALGRRVVASENDFPSGGNTLKLTIHPGIQYIAEQELARAVTRWQAIRGIAIVISSDNGEILAMAQSPGFNPNSFQDYDKSAFFNRAITSGYEPGSTFKVITAAAALEAAAIQPDDQVFCEEGVFQHFDSVIHDTKPHRLLKLEGILRVSSNICAAKVGMAMPVRAFHGYIERFGFGIRTGIYNTREGYRLDGEADGYVLPPEKWTPIDHAAISFGHGILVSPLQLIMAVNTIATGGTLLKPILVREIYDSEGKGVEKRKSRVVRRILSPTTAGLVRDYMVAAVGPEGTGPEARVEGYQVAGKTGTTEKYDIKARGYSKTRQNASFVGFLPAYRPELTILVLIEEPQEGHYGGTVAAPVFREIARRALPLIGVWPEEGVKRIALQKQERTPASN